ncbi:hypothetical protein L1049_028405 [Liquidambar formosana]|uniref:Uncharacterized protein n=1 Tax=Liquidambar formosana TaxID=63359 RepID=A0AAP0RIP5_LIQFO
MVGSSSPTSSHSYASRIHHSGIFKSIQPKEENLVMAASVYGLPLSPIEYRSFFEAQNMKPEAEYILDPQNSNGWRDFNRSMFWLAVIGGSLILVHGLLLFILKLRKKNSEEQRDYGALTFPRFEIFLVLLALPCLCEASAALIRGGVPSGVVVGILQLGLAFFLLLALILFLSVGITFGKLLQYKEVHQEGQKFHWYQDIIRVTLGPGKRGQWTWKNEPNSVHRIRLGPIFEDLRGPPKYMVSQISGGNPQKHGDRIIPSDDETEDAEAPFIQKLFGILRIYYTVIESVKRVALGIVAGAYAENWSSKTPIITLLCITSFQLFFLVLKKPFIKKKVQLVEIISVSSELGIFASCLVLLLEEFSARDETKLGIFMLVLFLVGFFAQMINEWYALYGLTKQLDPAEKSFLWGLETALIGFLLLFIPWKMIENLDSKFPVIRRRVGETSETVSGTPEKPWLKQLREMAKASFKESGVSTERSRVVTDPSTSNTQWSGIWGTKRSGSSSMTSSSDYKSKPSGLDKDLEAIFAFK